MHGTSLDATVAARPVVAVSLPGAGLATASLRDQAARVLRAQIVSGELEPGRLHTIGQVAAALAVSITPVREAVLELAKEGLVAIARNRGFRVVEPSEKDLDDILEVRLMLEVAAVRDIAARRLVTDPAPLREAAARAASSAQAQDWAGFINADRDLHMALLAVLDNGRLLDAVGQLRDQTRLYGLHRAAGTPAMLESTREHDVLLDAVEAGDPAAAEALTAHHLAHTRGIWAGRSE